MKGIHNQCIDRKSMVKITESNIFFLQLQKDFKLFRYHSEKFFSDLDS